MSTVPQNFLGLPERYTRLASSRYVVLPIPYDSTTSFQVGTRHGPSAIIRASQQVELFDDELEGEFYDAGVHTLDPLEPNMAGPEAMTEDIFRAAKPHARTDKFVLGLGGEHSVTAGLVRAVMTRHKRLSVLQIDAHLDLRDEYEGTRGSHACVMRRVLEGGASVVPVGIRNVSAEEHRFVKKSGLRVFSARECAQDDDWIDEVLARLGDNVYITIDIDGLDPAHAPGTGTPEPGGLDWYQLLGLLRLVTAEKNVVGADIVEVMPIPGQAVTEFLAAKLGYKIIAYTQASQ